MIDFGHPACTDDEGVLTGFNRPHRDVIAGLLRAEPELDGFEAYERKIGTLAHRIGGLLDGDESDRDRRAWSIVALMVGALTISRAMPEHSDSRTASLDAARRTAIKLIDTTST